MGNVSSHSDSGMTSRASCGDAVELTCDVLVIGSGAAGLAAAVTAAHHELDVIVIEKAPVFGGTSAWSGGWLWIPGNPLATAGGITESPSEPRRYLRHELGNRGNDPRIDMFLDKGPEMVRFFDRETAVKWKDGNAIPDFHQSPGHATGGRSVSARPYDLRQLGDFRHKLRPPLDLVSLAGMGIAGGADIGHFFNASRSLTSLRHVMRRTGRHMVDLIRYRRGTQLVNGNALVARLLRSALDLNVRLIENTSATELISAGLDSGSRRITGVIARTVSQTAEAIAGQKSFEHGDSPLCILASRGVVLATGGFPHDKSRIAATFKHAPTGKEHFSAAPFENSGDGIRLAEQAGGQFDNSLVNAGAWSPVSIARRKDGSVGHFPHLVERAKPGFIAVDPSARRFVNEADSYHDFMGALFDRTPSGQTPHAWLLCDHNAQRRYGLGWAKPFPFRVKPMIDSGYLKCARTMPELARQCGLPVEELLSTVERFNAAALQGKDRDFNRGESPYNAMQAESGHGPNPSLGTLSRAPYYAVKVVPGSLGTFAGLATDSCARVLDAQDQPIEGLYAIGNDMASIMGGHYPAGGITLGPGMTFGYIVGRLLAGFAVSHGHDLSPGTSTDSSTSAATNSSAISSMK